MLFWSVQLAGSHLTPTKSHYSSVTMRQNTQLQHHQQLFSFFFLPALACECDTVNCEGGQWYSIENFQEVDNGFIGDGNVA